MPTQDTVGSSPDAPVQEAPDPFSQFAKDKAAGNLQEDTPNDLGDPQPISEDPPDWKEMLPESYRQDGYLSRFNSMDEFLKGVQNLRNLASKKGLEKPDVDAPPEHWNDYWETVGRPTNPEDYAIENLTDSTGQTTYDFGEWENLGELKQEFHQQGLTNEQAQFIMNKYAQSQMASEAQAQEAATQRLIQSKTELQQEYKEATDATIRRSLNALEGVGLYDLLAEAGLETDPRAIRVGVKLSSEFSEAVVGPQGSTKTSSDRLAQLESSKAFLDAMDPNHKSAVAERNRLLKELY